MINRVYKATLQTLSGGREEIQKGAEVSPIKYGTFHYAATAGNLSTYGKGGAFSSYIEFEYYTSGGVTLNKGDMLLYAQEWDTDTSFADITPSREQGINVYYVFEINEKRKTNYVLAYDMIEAKLDVDFSEMLKANESSFPMTIEALCNLVAQLTDVYPPWYSVVLSPPDRTNYWKEAKLNYFYSPGITARNIYNWIGEIIGQKLMYLWGGDMTVLYAGSRGTDYKTFASNENNYWQSADKYVVAPDDGTYTINGNTAINAWYKENGLEIGKTFTTYDGVEIVAPDGSLLGSYYTATPATNVLRIVGNMIVENIATFANIYYGGGDTGIVGTYNDLAEDILNNANVVSGMTTAKVQLFPFRCPYTIGSRMYCFDTDGNQYIVPIMSIDLTEDGVTIGAYGNEYGADDSMTVGSGNTSDTAALWAKLNKTSPLRTDTITATTNAYGNIFTTLGEDCVVLSAIRTGNTASMCVPFWNEATSVWGIHVMSMSAAAVTSTSVIVEIVYLQNGAAGTPYYLVDANGNYLTDNNGNRLTVMA